MFAKFITRWIFLWFFVLAQSIKGFAHLQNVNIVDFFRVCADYSVNTKCVKFIVKITVVKVIVMIIVIVKVIMMVTAIVNVIMMVKVIVKTVIMVQSWFLKDI